MANPITPNGRRRRESLSYAIYDDIQENARRQDEERQIREDDALFEETGINRLNRGTNDPLVDNDAPDLASDGDTYDERLFDRHTVANMTGWAEDSPTQIISSPSSSRAREAYRRREQVKNDKEFKEKSEKNKKKFKSAITGLDINQGDL